ncbi:MAG: ligase-associated DNA damage response DEXH box helicase [Cyclobacteriaceae bacterium]|nr:ligase-associated DNA damage response DEXH box helicase [Cyclobacteriaceae bacterium]MCB0500395.1 ligase-associated DNA damage response DEXH box helicase [Cyclobacteriaceae bacterium]MCB9238670.1 ligase-associated DNA damage response DEXH box helicase [Flammeovirgaceae bacterium]MCO5271828.1 ligase-associated DNA damage response DEXH box helicase [Cyclobacteriaceae bacterium]MCW5901170.1 ligase-associated DNA damage response DEXH box helicase [Cyclobacteriaceae bacterium]
MKDNLIAGKAWFKKRGWCPFPFQLEAWEAYLKGRSGVVNAPTGSGKTYSLVVPIILEALGDGGSPKRGLQAIWLTPIRALAKEIKYAAELAIAEMGLDWEVGVRSGDTPVGVRKRQKESPPQFLITTPESLHLLIAQKGYTEYFKGLKVVVADEWHELMGSKRGVQVELALSRIKSIATGLKVWGISATIGNMRESVQVLLGDYFSRKNHKIIRAAMEKDIRIQSIMPDDYGKVPWTGHIGTYLLDKVVEIIAQGTATLIFTNTRSFAEIWYQKLLDKAPGLSGLIAMHHGSISLELRGWVEEQLHLGKIKAVVCTSSLDLGVDFRPVETVIQIGSPKGIARFLQRAGRSGHRPGATSKIYYLPTHALELIEAAAIREALKEKIVEDRIPYVRSFDVLVQYLITLAVSEGFEPERIFREVRGTYSYSSLQKDEWDWLLRFINTGGAALAAYDEFRKVNFENGMFKVDNRRTAHRHRLSIGTIVGDTSLWVKYVSGKTLGSIEEYFISSLNKGDVFWFAGRNLELVRVKDMTAQVRRTKRKSGKVPSWQGGRMPLSSEMGGLIRHVIHEFKSGRAPSPEMKFLTPMLQLQESASLLPGKSQFLIECLASKEGFHVMMYPFEGRFVHEGMAALMAYRISRIKPITFSIAMNDYGFELLSDQEIPIGEAVETNMLGVENLKEDIMASINSVEMARRKFRDIAAIAGLVFKGFPGQRIKDRHLQSSSQLFFEVFHDHESHNLLLQQAFEEVMDFQLEESRLRRALERIARQKIVIKYPDRPTPFAFPIMVDRLREKLTSEKLEDRVRRMMVRYK